MSYEPGTGSNHGFTFPQTGIYTIEGIYVKTFGSYKSIYLCEGSNDY